MITEGIHYGNQAGKTERKLWNRKYLQPRFSQIEEDERLNNQAQIV
jgi:hypothetical protein